MQKEIPILFSTAMVQAILEGRKTVTRRIVKPQPDDDGLHDHSRFPMSLDDDINNWYGTVDETGESKEFNCPYGFAGDILYVREKFYAGYRLDENDSIPDDAKLDYWYFADTRDARPADMSDSHCYHLFGADKKI